MCLEKIESAKNPTDMLTKCVDVGKLRLCKTSDGLLQLLLKMLRRSKDVDDEDIFFLRMYFWMTESVSKWENCQVVEPD